MPGATLNPRGRPPVGLALSEVARRWGESNDHALLDWLMEMAWMQALRIPMPGDLEYIRARWKARLAGEADPPPPTNGEHYVATPEEAARARDWLARVGWKLPAAQVDVRAGALEAAEVDYTRLPSHVLEAIEAASAPQPTALPEATSAPVANDRKPGG